MNIFLNSAGLQEGSDVISSAVALGDFIYVSAQTGNGDTIEEQTITAMNKVIDAVSPFGLSAYHMVKFTVYMTDIQQKQAFLDVYQNFVEAPFPAMSIVQVQALEDGSQIAIEGYAVNTLRYEKASQEHSCGQGCDSCSGGCSHS